MSVTTRAIAVAGAVLTLALALHAADFVVVANKDNGPSTLSKVELKRMYTGRQTSLGSLRIVPINLPLDSEAARKFLEQVVGMTPAEYKKYWVEQQVRGQATAPMIQRTGENAVAVISELPGGVGYVETGTDVTGVKTIALTD
jgi:ABC-type phosphate transport system substrate-binding protein